MMSKGPERKLRGKCILINSYVTMANYLEYTSTLLHKLLIKINKLIILLNKLIELHVNFCFSI